VTVAAGHWGVLPSVAARDLDDDPEQLALVCRALDLYSELKRTFDQADSEDELKRYADSELMAQVKENSFGLHRERVARWKAEREKAERDG